MTKQTYQVKITLRDSKPPIWRRLLLDADTPLPVLSDIILAAFGWENYHLHKFSVGETDYMDTQYDMDWGNNEADFTLADLAPNEKSKVDYMYDFGDSWEHRILVEKILPADPDQTVPWCLKAVKACPPEDVGGIGMYYFFLDAINDPTHEAYAHYHEWIGGEGFDPDHVALEAINKRLATYR